MPCGHPLRTRTHWRRGRFVECALPHDLPDASARRRLGEGLLRPRGSSTERTGSSRTVVRSRPARCRSRAPPRHHGFRSPLRQSRTDRTGGYTSSPAPATQPTPPPVATPPPWRQCSKSPVSRGSGASDPREPGRHLRQQRGRHSSRRRSSATSTMILSKLQRGSKRSCHPGGPAVDPVWRDRSRRSRLGRGTGSRLIEAGKGIDSGGPDGLDRGPSCDIRPRP